MTARQKPPTPWDHPGTKCPCAECAGERGRVERAAQGLPPGINDPTFWGQLAAAVAKADAAKDKGVAR